MKKSFKILSLIFVITILFGFNQVLATNETETNYEINSYNVKIDVNENNTFDIQETMSIKFLNDDRNFIRVIEKNETVLNNGTLETVNVAGISNLKSNVDIKVKENLDKMLVKLEDTKNQTDTATYILNYTYDFGPDPFKDKDEFYYNLLNYNMQNKIYDFSFEIEMPKDISKEKVELYAGVDNKLPKEKLTTTIENNTIRGYYAGKLDDVNGLSIKIDLPDGYFINEYKNRDNAIIISVIVISILGVAVSYILWKKYGDDEKIVKEKVESFFGKYNSAELSLYYKGDVQKEDIMMLAFDLANKGYLKIELEEKDILFVKDKSLVIKKLKNYDGNNELEKLFFNELFKEKDVVREEELSEFRKIVEKIENKLERKENVKKIFDESGKSKGKYVFLISLLVLLITNILVFYGRLKFTGMFAATLVTLIEFIALKILFAIKNCNFRKISHIMFAILSLFLAALFASSSIATIVMFLNGRNVLKIAALIGTIAFVIIYIIKLYMPKRTKFGIQILGKIEGFKEYVESLDEKNIEDVLKKNPNYLSEILSESIVLNEFEKWNELFKLENVGNPKNIEISNKNDINVIVDELINIPNYNISKPKDSNQKCCNEKEENKKE